MAVTSSYLTYVLDQLSGLGEVVAKRMFGGIGLYSGGAFFGLIDDDIVYLRVDDASRPEFVARGMPAFRPVRSKPELVSVSYYQVPGEVLEDAEQLVGWARHARDVARQAAPQKKRVRKAGAAAKAPVATRRVASSTASRKRASRKSSARGRRRS
ncbi:MAG TPA: TfoX/Sxy family protein [Polyangiales bacterium]|nr:TfoX/Sxy family protein [Polyangiales bacterium]